MFKFLKKKEIKKNCLKCKHYNRDTNECNVTAYDNLISFPFKNTNCKLYKRRLH